MTTTLHLSRLILDPRSRAVRRDLADGHALHQRVMTAFPTSPSADAHARQTFGVLYRLDIRPLAQRPTLLVQSATAPVWSHLPDGYLDAASGLDGLDNPTIKPLDDRYAAIAAGHVLTFRLRANPTKRLHRDHAATNRLAGKRVALLKEEVHIEWLERKARDGGFALLTVHAQSNDLGPVDPAARFSVPDVRTMPAPDQTGWHPRSGVETGRDRLTFGAVVFEGRLRVLDPDQFRQTLAAGIGSGKAYGFGLLSIAPAAATN